MAFFDERPNIFRIVFASIAAILLFLVIGNLYYYATTPTGEHRFRNTPGTVYITQSFPATLLDIDAPMEELETLQTDRDSIRTGDILLAVENNFFANADSLQSYLAETENDVDLEIVVFRPSILRDMVFALPREQFPDSLCRDIPRSVFVWDIIEGGASHRADIRVGDLILSINSRRFKDRDEANRIMAFARAGNAIDYEVLRENQLLSKKVVLAKIGLQASVIFLLLCGFLYMATGSFIALSRPAFPAARIFGWAFLAIGFFMMIAFQGNRLSGGAAEALTFFRNFAILIYFPLGMHLSFHFPIERPETSARKWVTYIPYALAILFLLLSTFVNYDWVVYGFLVLFVYTMIIGLIYRRKDSTEYKKLNRVVERTALLVALSMAGFVIYIANFMDDATRAQAGYYFSLFFSISFALIPFAYLYTIGHYRLLDMDLRVRRNVQYNIISAAWLILLSLLLLDFLFYLPVVEMNLPNVKFEGAYIEVMDEPMAAVEKVMAEKSLIILLTIGLIALFWRVRRTGQRFIDRKFDRTEYDYRKATTELGEVMNAQFTGHKDLAEAIVSKLATLMQLKQVGVLFFRNEKESYGNAVYGISPESWDAFYRTVDQQMIGLIQRNRADYRFSADYLPEEIQDTFMNAGFRHIIAIRSKEKLVGVLVVGEKRSESPFNKEDLVFLASVSKQTAVAIENAFLYEEQAEQQRLRHELEIARRIQIASLPQTHPKIDGLDIAGISIPAQEVGGDYFDYLNGVPGEVTVIVGDVSGKGTSAAFYMSKVQGIMRSLNDFGLPPRELFIRANQLLINNLEKQSFITAVGAAFNAKNRTLQFARAGHSPLFYYQAQSREVKMLTPKGLGLGLTGTPQFSKTIEQEELCYESGDVFLFITDGITEAHSISGDEFGDEQLLNLLAENNESSAKRIRDQIITAVNHFSENTHQHDDLTLVVVKAV